MEIKFKILGKPRGNQRPRMCVSFGKQVTYTPKQTSEYEKLVKASYMAVSKIFFKKDIPLEINITAFFNGKFSNNAWATKKPDSDNIIKIVLDGLNKVAYYDDSQVCKVNFEKKYADIPRVEVKIKSLEEKSNMKTTKIYDDEKMVYKNLHPSRKSKIFYGTREPWATPCGNCYVNTVIFRGRIYDEIKEIKSNGVKFLLQISNGKDDITGQWNKPTFAECSAFGETAKRIAKEYKPKDEIWLTAKYYSKEVDGKYYKGFIVREIITEQEIEKASEDLLDDLPF